MTVGLLEGITSAIGQQLNELGGLRSTRIEVGQDAAKGDLYIQVETTIGWASAGHFYAGGYLHKYTGVAAGLYPARLTGVTFYDGVAYLPGVGTDLEGRTEVVDYTRVYSAADKMWGSFLVDYATGSDLDTLARNIGVFRQPELITTDDVFRNVIKAIAYSPRGTMYVIELYLDALFGAGNYRVFEDMTNSGYVSRLGETTVNNPGQIFVSTQLAPSQESSGSAYVTGAIPGRMGFIAPGGTTPLAAAYGGYPGSGTPRLRGCVFKPEGGRRIVMTSTNNPNYAATAIGTAPASNEMTVTFVQVGGINALDYVQVGDVFASASGPLIGNHIGLASVDIKGTVIEVVPVLGGGTVKLGVESNMVGTPLSPKFELPSDGWVFFREKTLCDSYFPSGDAATEGDPQAAGAIEPVWAFSNEGTAATEGGIYVFRGPGVGTALKSTLPSATPTDCSYRQEARVFPDSDATFEAQVILQGDFQETTTYPAYERDEFYMELVDGDPFYTVAGKQIRVGIERDAVTPGTDSFPNLYLGFVNTSTGAWLSSTQFRLDQSTAGVAPPTTIKITKKGTESVVLTINNTVVESVNYSSFATHATAGDQYRKIGIFGTNAPNAAAQASITTVLSYLDWSSDNNPDITNIRILNATALNVNEVMDDAAAGLLGSVVAGDYVTVTTASQPNDNYLGSALGEYEVDTPVTADKLILKGIRRQGNAIVTARPSGGVAVYDRVRIGTDSRGAGIQEADEPYAFTFPQDLGKKIRIYTGAAYEERTITKILDPVSGDSFAELFGIDESVLPNVAEGIAWESIPKQHSNYIQVDSDFATTYSNADWSVEPNFRAAQDTGIAFEAIRIASYIGAPFATTSSLTLKVGYTKPLGWLSTATAPRLSLTRTMINTAQVLDPDRANALTTPPAYDYYPFYLTGSQIGSAVNVLQKVLTAAGVHVNLRSYEYNATGDHII